MIYDLIKSNAVLGKSLLSYYMTGYNHILPLQTFSKYPNSIQLGVILEYLANEENLVILTDMYNFQIVYKDLEQGKEIFNEKGVRTDILMQVKHKDDIKSIIDCYCDAIRYIFNVLLQPF